jgi:hypothetical protein
MGSNTVILIRNDGFDQIIENAEEWGPELTEWAAEEAARVLIQNWKQALQDGYELEVLLKDVDEVVDVLTEWRDGLRKANIAKQL